MATTRIAIATSPSGLVDGDGVRAMVETYQLEQAEKTYARRMSVVLTM
jgi:hypothetical protein